MSLSNIGPVNNAKNGFDNIQYLAESDIPDLGQFLLKRGLVETDELERARTYQLEQSANGNEQLLGQILIELNLIDPHTLEKCLVEELLNIYLALKNKSKDVDDLKENQYLIHHQQTLSNFTSKLWGSTDIDTILQTTIQELRKIVKFSRGQIHLNVPEAITETLDPSED